MACPLALPPSTSFEHNSLLGPFNNTRGGRQRKCQIPFFTPPPSASLVQKRVGGSAPCWLLPRAAEEQECPRALLWTLSVCHSLVRVGVHTGPPGSTGRGVLQCSLSLPCTLALLILSDGRSGGHSAPPWVPFYHRRRRCAADQ